MRFSSRTPGASSTHPRGEKKKKNHKNTSTRRGGRGGWGMAARRGTADRDRQQHGDDAFRDLQERDGSQPKMARRKPEAAGAPQPDELPARADIELRQERTESHEHSQAAGDRLVPGFRRNRGVGPRPALR